MAQRGSWASYVIWGSVAVCAVLAASVTIALVVGAHRGILFAGPAKRPEAPATQRAQTQAAVSQPAKVPVPSPGTPSPLGPTSYDLAQINDAVRALAAARDRLMERLERIERTVGDITASIKNQPAPMPADPAPDAGSERIAATPAQPSPAAARSLSPRAGAIVAAASAPDPTEIFRPYAAVRPFVNPPVPTQAPVQVHALPPPGAPGATESSLRTEFAVDLGSEPSMDGLRALWTYLRGNHGGALANLRPLVSIRESGRPDSMELRLIAGPLANAGAAARTCAALQPKGVPCRTTVFDGQRLALR